MEMYGKKDKSLPQKWFIVTMEILFLLLAYWIMFLKGGEKIDNLLGIDAKNTNLVRNTINLAFSIIVFLRINVATFVWLKRQIPWAEAASIPFAFALYYISFSILEYHKVMPLNAVDYIAILLFIMGSYLNTAAEIQRYIWKLKPENKGKIYTKGLFKYSMHINYFGDILWVSAYALLSHNWYSILIPIWLFLFFQYYNIPKLDEYLSEKYKEAFQEYKQKTKSFIPFIL